MYDVKDEKNMISHQSKDPVHQIEFFNRSECDIRKIKI
jgi:hypothetical protein